MGFCHIAQTDYYLFRGMCHAMAPAGLPNAMFGRVATGASPGAVHPLGTFANICQRNMADVQFYSLHQSSLMASDCRREAQSIASAPTYLEGRAVLMPKMSPPWKSAGTPFTRFYCCFSFQNNIVPCALWSARSLWRGQGSDGSRPCSKCSVRRHAIQADFRRHQICCL